MQGCKAVKQQYNNTVNCYEHIYCTIIPQQTLTLSSGMFAMSGMCLMNASPHSVNQASSRIWSRLFDNSCIQSKTKPNISIHVSETATKCKISQDALTQCSIKFAAFMVAYLTPRQN